MEPERKVIPIKENAPSDFDKPEFSNPIDDILKKGQNILTGKDPKRNVTMPDDSTKILIEKAEQKADFQNQLVGQRLDGIEQKIDLHTQKLVEQNQLLSARLDAQQNDIQEIRQDGKSTRTTIIVTGISIVLGLGALGYVFIQTLQSSQAAWLMKALDLIQQIPKH
ncbi:hypothetical protein [Desulfovibrio sp. UCD-KL4C]|uniref:hypothetical protein n=1 Tax=Desulfovibrio sp. UCD-KL4C TaxID=2578120 RepID=UPI0025BADF05|nr:hypothetical protein [Desulfovibrio sp. UCD-KL4C]